MDTKSAKTRRGMRARAMIAGALCLVIGVPSKWYAGPGESFVVGQWWDFFGAMVVYFCLRSAAPTVSAYRIALAAWLALVGNELLQLVEHPLLDALRRTTVGGIVLGSSFHVLDIVVITMALVVVVPMDRRWVSIRRVEACRAHR